MPTYCFTVPGPPVPKERARSAKNGRHYTPSRTRAYEKKIAACALEGGIRPLEGPVWMDSTIFFANRRHGDISNVAKAIEDGLNGIAYKDDKQIAFLIIRRRYDSDNPRVDVRLGQYKEPEYVK